jgi:DNA-directed RNA polymerase specialized sigma24 family protein
MALLLRDIAGFSYNEIAEILEITLATVKWRIHKAREEVHLTLTREEIAPWGVPAGSRPQQHTGARHHTA